MSRQLRVLLAGVVALALVGAGVGVTGKQNEYEINLVMSSAAQLLDGSPAWIDGTKVGSVTGLDVRDGKAIVTVRITDDHVPLHEGTTTRVEWHSVLGERVVSIEPGPAENPEIPSGALYEAETLRIEIDEVLAALDPDTRERLNSLIHGLRSTTSGAERDIKETVRSAGPAMTALGEILAALGRDGPAINSLVTQLRDMMAPLADRHDDIARVVADTHKLTGAVAEQQGELSEGLDELPATLRTARSTLDAVPEATQATVGLLEDLGPGVAKLPSVAGNLSPVLSDLRPTVAKLRPTLGAAEKVLAYTPNLIDSGHDVLPPLTRAARELGPAASFLRPYTPELVGWLTNWGQNFTGYDSQGHVWGVGQAPGPSANHDSMGAMPPLRVNEKPKPGEAGGQPWTDAHGSGMR